MLKTFWYQNRLEVKQPELCPVYLAFVQLEENDRYSLSCSGVMKVRSGGLVYVDHAVSKKDFWFLEYRRTGSLKIEHYKTYKIYLTLKFKKWAGLITGITFYCKRQTNFPSRLLGLKDCYDDFK